MPAATCSALISHVNLQPYLPPPRHADYDAPTQLVKPRERNTRYVDAVLTVPQGALYPMSSINLAFNRELIGAAMYSGLAGETASMPDDMWAGSCSKASSCVRRRQGSGRGQAGETIGTPDDM